MSERKSMDQLASWLEGMHDHARSEDQDYLLQSAKLIRLMQRGLDPYTIRVLASGLRKLDPALADHIVATCADKVSIVARDVDEEGLCALIAAIEPP